MKNFKLTHWCAVLMISAFFLATTNASAQTKNKMDIAVMQDCCMMKDGKMMQFKDGHMTKMHKKIVLENGTKVKRNGVCVMPDKSKIRMKEGNCIDMMGKIGDCAAMDKPRT